MKLSQYKNGNTLVTIFNDGTKMREYIGEPLPEYPESIDLKITNKCSLENYCKWCHEHSKVNGKHADLSDLSFLDDLPPGVELAIGGGNPLEHEDLISFLVSCKERGLICNITVNELHTKQYFALLSYLIKKELIYGLGISYSGKQPDYTGRLHILTSNIVYHLILGVNTLDQLAYLCKLSRKVLLLGYKQFRKGEDYYSEEVENNLYQWYICLYLHLNKMSISFDNLAIKQLNIGRFLPNSEWDTFYMGDDGQFTMYIDLVEKKFAKSSTSMDRYDLLDMKSMFNKIRSL